MPQQINAKPTRQKTLFLIKSFNNIFFPKSKWWSRRESNPRPKYITSFVIHKVVWLFDTNKLSATRHLFFLRETRNSGGIASTNFIQ
tara:strand:- start:2940 stop:3200 length:261 start_codon:yes stop_codon:yes gene_type:complete